MITQLNNKSIIRKYLGVPYRHMGRDTKQGLDCWGLIKNIYSDSGIALFDLDSYEQDWSNNGENYFIENYSRQWDRVEHPKFMDIVIFKMKDVANHAGLVLDEYRFIHCCKSGVVINRIGELHWSQRTAGFFRIKEI